MLHVWRGWRHILCKLKKKVIATITYVWCGEEKTRVKHHGEQNKKQKPCHHLSLISIPTCPGKLLIWEDIVEDITLTLNMELWVTITYSFMYHDSSLFECLDNSCWKIRKNIWHCSIFRGHASACFHGHWYVHI